MGIDRDKIKSAFDNYVSNYNSNDGKIRLKIIHTYNVSKVCVEIAQMLNFSVEDTDIAYAIGMLHDIGRFEQIKRYGTFNDSKSINHGRLGVQILFDEGKIRDFIDDDSYDMLIKQAISYHNMYEIPQGISERTLIFSKLIRDADKIDIFRVNVTDPKKDVYEYSEEEMINSEVTKDVVEAFKKLKTISRTIKKTPVDTIISHIALVFGIYFAQSMKIIKKQGYLERMIEFKSNNDITNMAFDEIREIVKKYINNFGGENGQVFN